MFKKSKSKKIFSRGKPTALASQAVYYKGDDRLQFIPESYQIDESLSSKKITTMVNPDTKEVISAFRGSKSKSDAKQDVMFGIGLNRLNPDYQEAYKNTKKVQEKYKGYDLTLTGHSKGSKMSYDIGNKRGIKSVNYDLPSSIFDFTPKNILYNNIKKNDKAEIHHTIGDPVGGMGFVTASGNKNVIYAKGMNPHTISNYL